jgi:peptidoglycan hydrolase-like protein with peptidoglycan-binding domain
MQNKTLSKIMAPVMGLAMFAALVVPAGAQTVAELQAQINALMAQLAALSGGSTVSVTFTQNLTVGSTGSEVVALQQMLVAQGHLVMPAGVAYGYFGGLTRAAVAKWQAANGVAPAAGYWGPLSRAREIILTEHSDTLPPPIVPPVETLPLVDTLPLIEIVKSPVVDPIVNIPSTPPEVVFLYSQYYLYEPVTFSLRNVSSNPMTLKNGAPWVIQDSSGTIIFSPVSTQALVVIAPGESQTWKWNQKNDSDIQVLPGQYKIFFPDLGVSKTFTVTSKVGSQGYFTFDTGSTAGKLDPNRVFRAYFTNPQTVRESIENYYGINAKFPSGLLVDDRPNKSPYDSKWSWHLDPSQTTMAEMTIELCDSWPRFVEDNLDYMMKSVKTFCPWGAKVIDMN